MPWASVTVPSPAKPTIRVKRVFGWRLPGPFGPCASTGSHLTRFSELRLGRTSPALSHSYVVALVYVRDSRIVKHGDTFTCAGFGLSWVAMTCCVAWA